MAKRSIRKTRHMKLTNSERGRKSELVKKGFSGPAAHAKVVAKRRNTWVKGRR